MLEFASSFLFTDDDENGACRLKRKTHNTPQFYLRSRLSLLVCPTMSNLEGVLQKVRSEFLPQHSALLWAK